MKFVLKKNPPFAGVGRSSIRWTYKRYETIKLHVNNNKKCERQIFGSIFFKLKSFRVETLKIK